ncbi:Hypothetical predicted protein, partial [Paramuricea clavata]
MENIVKSKSKLTHGSQFISHLVLLADWLLFPLALFVVYIYVKKLENTVAI